MSAPRIRIIRHEAVPQTGRFEVRFADGRASQFFYFDDVLARRLRPEILTSEQALEQAKALARAERDGGNREAAPTLRGLQLPGPFLLAGAARHGLNSTPKR
jgi:hypothetical protein